MERDDRLQKLAEIKAAGINPYPAHTDRTHNVAQVLEGFDNFQKSEEKIILAGRLMSQRGHGNLNFGHLRDGSGEQIQIAVSKKAVGDESYKRFVSLLDMGDFIEVSGTCFLTHKGERSLMVTEWKFLTKALLPLPEKWHGLKDEEEILRKRYLDILINPEIRALFEKKSRFWNAMRSFLLERGFLEVETPILENTTGGADAKPFVTHHNALDIDVFLRISCGELWQKKLMVAGYEKTFEIGRQFRNEGMDAEHAQDYTQMEFYWGYADYHQGMDLVKAMYRHVAQEAFGTLKFNIKGFEVDLGQEWETYDYMSLIKEKTGTDVLTAKVDEIESKLRELKIDYDRKGFNWARGVDNLWKYCRKQIAGPGFLINVPVAISPLAKRLEANSELTQRFQVIIAGSELGNGYSELNDPVDQAERFTAQQKMREAGDEEAQMYDNDFVEALEHGMPPTCGFGVSERLFSFLADHTIRECQIFPLMRPKKIEN